MLSTGLSLLVKILQEGRMQDFIRLQKKHFYQEDEQTAYSAVKTHVDKYGTLPSMDTLRRKAKAIPSSPSVPEPFGYYLDEFTKRALYNGFSEVLPAVNKHLAKKDVDKAVLLIKEFMATSDNIQAGFNTDVVSMQSLGRELIEDVLTTRTRGGAITGIPTGWPTLDAATNGLQGGDVIVVLARPKMGKFHPVTEPVLTPQGWVEIGKLKIGDTVFTRSGKITKVTGIFPQGKQPVFKLKMSDDGYSLAGREHLWLVKHRSQGKFKKVKTTGELIEWLEKYSKHGRVYLPMAEPVRISKKKTPIDPYLMGLLLGDGSLGGHGVVLTKYVKTGDRGDLLSYVKESYVEYADGQTVGFPGLHMKLAPLGLMGKRAWEKFIPDVFKWNSIENRLALLQGLMDTDGTIEDDGRVVEYYTTSPQLAEDVKFLVQSLGGKTRTSCKRNPKYTHKGESLTGRDCFVIRFQLPVNPFRLKRKADRYKIGKVKTKQRLVKSITHAGDAECVCISVADPSKLYITRDFIVTHNTMMMLCMSDAAYESGYTPLVVSMEMMGKQMARRYFAKRARINLNDVRRGTVSYWGEERLRRAVAEMERKHLYHFVAGQFKKDISEIISLVHGLRPHILYIDGGYLIKIAGGERKASWEKISEIVEAIKTTAVRNNIPVVVSFQFNRQVGKNTKEVGLEHIQLSDAIAQIASLGIGIFEDDEETISGSQRRRIQIVGGREGESGEFKVHWDFERMEFSEVPEETYQGIQGATDVG